MTMLSRRTVLQALLGAPLLARAHDMAQHAPAPTAARRPALGMGAALSPDGALWTVSLDARQRLVLMRSDDLGRRWSAPQVLDIADDRISADGENHPKIAFGPEGVVVVSYTQPLPQPYAGYIRLLRSGDGGRSFAAPATVHHDQRPITHRFESIGFDAQGRLHVAWIDKRDLLAAGEGYRGAAIYRTVSRDGGRSFEPETKLADHSCECCRIALAPTPDGGMAALWRHVFEPNERDHAFARLGTEAPVQRATLDHWAIDACPHHGPSMAPADGGGFHAVWFGERGGRAGVRYGRLDADGKPSGDTVELPDDRAEHAVVAEAGERVAVAWRSTGSDGTRLRAWISKDGGRSFALRELAASPDDNDHPRLVQRGDRIVALWRHAKGIHVESL